MEGTKKLIIIGAGGFAKSVLDSLEGADVEICGFIDDIKLKGAKHLGYRIIGNSIECVENPHDYFFFIAIGNNAKRKRWFDELKSKGLALINVIDKNAIVSGAAIIGEGCFVGKLAILNYGCSIEDDCVINSRALVEHGCRIGSHCNISTNTTLNGDVVCCEGCFVGSGSVVNGQMTIGEWALVGSGAVVIRDVKPRTTVVGIPAKEIPSRNHKYN